MGCPIDCTCPNQGWCEDGKDGNPKGCDKWDKDALGKDKLGYCPGPGQKCQKARRMRVKTGKFTSIRPIVAMLYANLSSLLAPLAITHPVVCHTGTVHPIATYSTGSGGRRAKRGGARPNEWDFLSG